MVLQKKYQCAFEAQDRLTVLPSAERCAILPRSRGTAGLIKSVPNKAAHPVRELMKGSEVSHEDLIMRVADVQDRSAFAALFAHYAPRLKSYLIKQGLDAARAEDLAQDVMVKVWHKAALFDPAKARLSTWIFRIARNQFIDVMRKRKYPEVEADVHLVEMVAPDETDHPLEARQTKGLVSGALSKLSADQAAVIQLSFYEELSHSEIAEKLKLPLGTVKSRIRLAFNILRKELGNRT